MASMTNIAATSKGLLLRHARIVLPTLVVEDAGLLVERGPIVRLLEDAEPSVESDQPT